MVAAKIQGLRLLIRRNHKGTAPPRLALCRLDRLEYEAGQAESLETLLGIEGAASAGYFGALPDLLADRHGSTFATAFHGRRKRPPTDPLNAALSFTYAMLTRAVTVAVTVAGFDARLGFLHTPRAGRPALALDLMEPLRPLIADSAVLTAINNGRLSPEHFTHDDGAVLLNAAGRKAVIAAFEQRLSREITHPAFARGPIVTLRSEALRESDHQRIALVIRCRRAKPAVGIGSRGRSPIAPGCRQNAACSPISSPAPAPTSRSCDRGNASDPGLPHGPAPLSGYLRRLPAEALAADLQADARLRRVGATHRVPLPIDLGPPRHPRSRACQPHQSRRRSRPDRRSRAVAAGGGDPRGHRLAAAARQRGAVDRPTTRRPTPKPAKIALAERKALKHNRFCA